MLSETNRSRVIPDECASVIRAVTLPVARSVTVMALSAEPVNSCVPSRENFTARHDSLWALPRDSCRSEVPVSASKRWTCKCMAALR